MATDRVLVEIVTAANMAGIAKAKAGFLSMNKSTLLLAAGLGILVTGGKSMLDNWKDFEVAHKNLEQAFNGNKAAVKDLQGTFDKWVRTNKRYVKDQSDAETALAAFIRSGRNAKDAMRLLNDALDISVIKHESVTEAGNMLTLALAGNSRGLRFLGISTTEYNAIMKSHLTTAQKHAALLALVEQKTKDGRKAQDDSAQSANDLNNSWMELSKKGGPVLEAGLKFIVDRLNDAYDWFDKIGKDDSLWAAISDRLVKMARWIHDWVIVPAIHAYNAIARIAHWQTIPEGGPAAQPSGPFGKGGKASGGPVGAGMAYTVGERGPETLVMGSRGGAIIPNGGGGIHHHWHIGTLIASDRDFDQLANRLLRRARYAPGT